MRLKLFIISEASATRTTALQETLFAVGYAISQLKGGNITEPMLSDGDLFTRAYDAFVKTDISVNDVFLFGQEQPSYITSVVSSVNALRKHSFISGKYDIYRTVGIMKQVYDTMKLLMKKEGIRLPDDKWNPGDVWMSKLSSMPTFDNIYEYNNFISKQLQTGKLIGVSLKKTSNAKVIYVKQESDTVEPFEYRGVSKPTTPFNTGVRIATNNPKLFINIRSFRISKQATVRAELLIKGSEARHGKAALTNLYRKYNIHQTSKSEITKQADNPEILAQQVIRLWADLGYTYNQNQIENYYQKKVKNGFGDVVGYFMSIINSLEFAVHLQKHKSQADNIVTEVIRIAASKNELSSEYLKIM